MNKRLLIIGIDGGTWKVLEAAIAGGYMPTLKALKEKGAAGPLLSTIPPKTPAAWGTFQTGKNPGANGVFDFAWWDRQTHRSFYVSSASLGETLWDAAGRAGKHVGVINVPMTYPPRPIEGKLVTGILTPSMDGEWTYPPSLKEELLRAVPGYHIFNLKNIKTERVHSDRMRFLRRMAEIVDCRAGAACYLLAQETYDLFMVHFQASDVVQHAMWGLMCPDHPDYDPAICRQIYEQFYNRLDRKIAEVRDAFARRAGDSFVTLILSDHGFQTHRKRVNLGWWLVQQGFLKVHPVSPRRLLGHLMKRLRGSREPLSAQFIWEESRVFSFSRGNDGFLYFLEADPAKRDRTQRELGSLLKSLSDPQTGQPIVQTIHPRRSIYSGPYASRMPDWVVVPADGYSFTGDYLPRQKSLLQPVRQNTDFHVGMHHPEGILLACGPDVKQGVWVEGSRLVDLAATILAFLGVAIPKDMEGRVLSDLFIKGPSEVTATREEGRAASGDRDIYSEQDVNLIQQRLRDLGYIE